MIIFTIPEAEQKEATILSEPEISALGKINSI
jgi:hypothetical protein